jgi:multicomponent Na+:H+ antiporter subunit B
MEGTVFTYAAKRIKPLMLIFSVIVLFRGHNEPGGGFIGGLIAASAFILVALSTGPGEVKKGLCDPEIAR